jgi:hypothetical protein
VNDAGTASGNSSSNPAAITRNGRFVLFGSYASDLVAMPKGNLTACDGFPCPDAFVRNLRLGTTTLVSVNGTGTGGGNNGSDPAAFTANGRSVLFGSSASDLVTNDSNDSSDVFLRRLR